MPPERPGKKTIANLEYEMLSSRPYEYTSDDVKFAIHSIRYEIDKREMKTERETYFSKGQPCFRASPLAKSYGWGIHYDVNGKMAIYGVESKEYAKYVQDKTVSKVRAMRSRRG